ncbi:MAG: hypothetical protein ACWIPJ_07215, partial [Polaribacter sp.]
FFVILTYFQKKIVIINTHNKNSLFIYSEITIYLAKSLSFLKRLQKYVFVLKYKMDLKSYLQGV